MKRIALVLASIHTGAANGLWADVARFSQQQEGETALFVFPGGRLQSLENHEHLRNALYRLVHKENVDGIIVWGSSLGGAASLSEVQQQYRSFGDLPCVTIGLKREGFPDITFDAYSGVGGILQHCITKHNTRRIAFIRGPENHPSSDDRYRSYLDTLKQNTIAYDPSLVSDPFAWTEGQKALEQLVDERSLVPGKDFDLLACSSDMMMFAAGKGLEGRGYRIPEDVKIVGFNDSSESHLLKGPCTTAKMPVRQLALMAWSMVELMVDKQSMAEPDILLPCEAVIRRSCGCKDSLGGYESAKALFTSDEAYLRYLTEAFSLDLSQTKAAEHLFSLCARFGTTLEEDIASQILEQVAHFSHSYLDGGGDPSNLSEALHWYSLFYASKGFSSYMDTALRDLFLRQHSLVSHEHAYAVSTRTKELNSFKCELLTLRNLSSHSRLFQRYLPSLGIEGCLLVLNEDESCSRFVGGFYGGQLYEQQVLFDKKSLLPPFIAEKLGSGVFVVEPLYMENQPMGYLVMKTTLFEGSLMEDLRTALSSSIKASFLLDEANKAKELAERAQRSRTEFFANVSEGLRNPLEEIQAKVSTLKGKEHEPLRISIDEEIFKATHLLDLSLSQTGELELERQILDPTSLVEQVVWESGVAYEGPALLPALFADRTRLKQVLSILSKHLQKESGQSLLSSSITEEGFVFSFRSSSAGWKAALSRQDPGISLAERIILLHGGQFWLQENTVSFRLPWPTLSGEVSQVEHTPSLFIADDQDMTLPPSFALLEGLAVLSASSLLQNPQLFSRYGLLFWDARKKGPSLMLLLHQMLRDSRASRLGFVCLGCPGSSSSFVNALNFSEEEGLVVHTGEIPAKIAAILCPTQGSAVQAGDGYWQQGDLKLPSLFITDDLSIALFREIRKVKQGPSVPIVLIRESFTLGEADQLSLFPQLLLVHSSVADSSEFLSRLIALRGGEDLLPPLTSALVKRAVVFIGEQATVQFSRWQLAEAVNVSEDYLTRIFRKEIGLSPWDYLNRHRVYLATALLRQTTLTINEVASQTGFQDQAYFCRVFKKLKGFPPGKVRSGE